MENPLYNLAEAFEQIAKCIHTFFKRPKFKIGFQFYNGSKIFTVISIYKSYDVVPDIYYNVGGYSPSERLVLFYLKTYNQNEIKYKDKLKELL